MKKFITACLLFITIVYGGNEEKITMILQGWNQANNEKDLDSLSRLYASKITYYGSKFSRSKCLKDKKRLFKKYPYFTQSILNVQTLSLSPRIHKVTFDKFVRIKPNEQEKMYPSYLIISTANSFPSIIEEGDQITNNNLKKKKKPLYSFDGRYTIKGKIIKVQHYGPPGYGENPDDPKLTAYILKLSKPITVISNDPDSMNASVTTKEIQLLAFDYLKQLERAARTRRSVTLTGEFFSGHTGYHIRELLMDVKAGRF